MSKNFLPCMIVACGCGLAALGFYRKDLDALDALALVGSAVTLAGGVHVRARKKKRPLKLPVMSRENKNGASP